MKKYIENEGFLWLRVWLKTKYVNNGCVIMQLIFVSDISVDASPEISNWRCIFGNI